MISNEEFTMTTLNEKYHQVTDPYVKAFNRPIHLEWMAKKVSSFHGALEGRLYKALDKESANFAIRLLYAIPMTTLQSSLSPLQSAITSVIGTTFLWGAGQHVMTERNKVNLLHSVAMASIASIVPQFNSNNTMEEWLKIPMLLTTAATALFAASTVQNETPVSKKA
jgi:hypothetical protein